MRGEDVEYLADTRLRRLGLLVGRDGSVPKLSRNDPMLALNLRMAVVPPSAVQVITGVLRYLFLPPIVAAVLVGLVGLDVWIFGFHGVAQSVRQLLYQPLDFLLVFGLILLSAGFHECGHASACRYSGATPGPLGAGVYLAWPVFYSDVTDAYRVGRTGRLRTDLGGVYFNSIFTLLTALAYFTTRFELLILVMVLQNLEILRQFMPFLRLDGYYVVADVTGVPDIFGRIKPILSSFLPGRPAAPTVTALKTWTRAVVTIWVVITVILLVYLYGVMLVALPRIIATTWSSLGMTCARAGQAWSHGDPLALVVACVQVVLLVVPVAGMGISLGRWIMRLWRMAWRRLDRRWRSRLAAAVVAVAASLLTVVALLPYPGRYTALGPHDGGTVQAEVRALAQVVAEGFIGAGSGTGRPARGATIAAPRPVGGFTIPVVQFRVPRIWLPGFWLPRLSVPPLILSTSGVNASVHLPRSRLPSPAPPSAIPSLSPSPVPSPLPSALPSSAPTPSPSLPPPSPSPAPTPSQPSPSPSSPTAPSP